MSGAKHTAGNWIAQEGHEGWEVVSDSGEPVARFVEVRIYDSCSIIDGLEEADAKLIAAAPKMLEALCAAADAMTMDQCDGDCQPGIYKHVERCPRRIVDVAIATARGESGEP